MIYLPYVILNILFDLWAMCTQWLVVLAADKDGNLPSFLRWYETWDHPSLDLSDAWNLEKYPSLYTSGLPKWLKTYMFRVLWLYRNTGYGFAYYILGYDVNFNTWVWKTGAPKGTTWIFTYDKSKSILTRGWCLRYEHQWFGSKWQCKVYLGWKVGPGESRRQMLAMNISPVVKFG